MLPSGGSELSQVNDQRLTFERRAGSLSGGASSTGKGRRERARVSWTHLTAVRVQALLTFPLDTCPLWMQR